MSRFAPLAVALLLVGCVAQTADTVASDDPALGAPPSPSPSALDDAAPATSEPTAAAPTTLPWNLLDCVFVYGTTFVPATSLADRMPEGFQTVLVAGPTAGTMAQIGFEVDVCAEGSGIRAQLSPMTYASTWTPAIPPDGKAIQGIGMFVNWDVLVPDEERRALMQAAGTPARDGDIAISTDLRAGAPVTPFTVDYDYDGVGFRFDIAPTRSSGAGGPGGEFAQYTVGDDGSLTFWRTKWAPSTLGAGAGTITLDPASWQAAAFGATMLPAQFQFGVWDYTEGSIALPP